jgi:Domain of unknown function (DUF4399)
MRVLVAGIMASLLCGTALAQQVHQEEHQQGGAAARKERRTMPEGARVYIISPRDGATVRPGTPIRVRMGLTDGGIAPAGVAKPGTGHHHLFIDTDIPQDLTTELPPTGPRIMHFGIGQTETRINLPPGRHTLQLVLGDEDHVPHSPPLISPKITIHVRNPSPPVAAATPPSPPQSAPPVRWTEPTPWPPPTPPPSR